MGEVVIIKRWVSNKNIRMVYSPSKNTYLWLCLKRAGVSGVVSPWVLSGTGEGEGGRFRWISWPGKRLAGGGVIRNTWSHRTRSSWADHGNAHPSAHQSARALPGTFVSSCPAMVCPLPCIWKRCLQMVAGRMNLYQRHLGDVAGTRLHENYPTPLDFRSSSAWLKSALKGTAILSSIDT